MSAVWPVLRHWAGVTLDLVYPRVCQFCRAGLGRDEPGVICRACLGLVKYIEPPFCQRCASPFAGEPRETYACGYCQDLAFQFDRAIAACRAEGVVRDAIHRVKYDRKLYFVPHLVDWLTQGARRHVDWAQVEVIVPVPLHPRKRREREFNQAELLAAGVGRAFDRPVARRAVRRVRDTGTQTRLDREARRHNLRGAFAVVRPAPVAERRVLLVDDVFTTGATLDACAKVLRDAGARQVTALTLARGI